MFTAQRRHPGKRTWEFMFSNGSVVRSANLLVDCLIDSAEIGQEMRLVDEDGGREVLSHLRLTSTGVVDATNGKPLRRA
jgi:hypothetical protein